MVNQWAVLFAVANSNLVSAQTAASCSSFATFSASLKVSLNSAYQLVLQGNSPPATVAGSLTTVATLIGFCIEDPTNPVACPIVVLPTSYSVWPVHRASAFRRARSFR